MSDYSLKVALRDTTGKGASRRLRRQANLVPAIVYGGEDKPQNISIEKFAFDKQLENEAFYSNIITLDIEGKEQRVILKDLQRHPAKPIILHADFQRVVKGQAFVTKVPLHFINEETSVGVKQQGGIITHLVTEVEISCIPSKLPEYLEIDAANVEIGDSLHLSQINLPEGVEITELAHGHDVTVGNCIKPRGMAEETEDESSDDAAQGEEGGEA